MWHALRHLPGGELSSHGRSLPHSRTTCRPRVGEVTMMRNLLWVVVSLAAFAAPVRGEALAQRQIRQLVGRHRLERRTGARQRRRRHDHGRSCRGPRSELAPLAGVTVQTGAALTFDPNVSATLQSTASVVVRGTLSMKPSSLAIVHLLQFVNVNEAAFVGGGLEVVPGDVGLWVRDGQLDLEGTPKTAWTRLAGGITSGTSSDRAGSVARGLERRETRSASCPPKRRRSATGAGRTSICARSRRCRAPR